MDEREIISLANNEDKASFEKLVMKYKPYVEKLSYQFGIAPEYISDIVQETFIKVYQNLDQFQDGKFSTWLYKITLNVTRDFYRKKQREKKIMNKAVNTQEKLVLGAYYFESDATLLLHLAIQELEEKYRLPLILFYFHDQTYEEIASILKSSLSSIKTRMHRGREKLKDQYIKLEEEGDSNGRQTFG